MRTKISNIIVFGDSMSDIGGKWRTLEGRLGALIGQMTVNETGRFSDGRNWTDFLWEWSGGERLVSNDAAFSIKRSNNARAIPGNETRVYCSLSAKLFYCNYAEGGAMASDQKSRVLGNFGQQAEKYLKERHDDESRKPGRGEIPNTRPDWRGATLHLIWIGLNDLVTYKLPAEEMPKVVDEMHRVISTIRNGISGGDLNHFVVLNMPSPADAARYVVMNDSELNDKLRLGAQLYNKAARKLFDGNQNVRLIDVASKIKEISTNPQKFDLASGHQSERVPIVYNAIESDSSERRIMQVTDKAHLSEAAYRVLAEFVAKELLKNYEIGDLENTLNKKRL